MTAKMRRLFESHEPTGPLVEELSEVSVLLIDELGAGVGKDWAHDLLNEVISYRYNNDLPIIATTNLKSKALEHAIGARLFSRICEMTQQVTVAGPDHRTGK